MDAYIDIFIFQLLGGRFETYWDDKEDEWMYKSAVQVLVSNSTLELLAKDSAKQEEANRLMIPVHRLCFTACDKAKAASRLWESLSSEEERRRVNGGSNGSTIAH